ncbi:MAG: ABC transporter ATP-binding protein [Peptococcaceae bacterium]|nr:ABC transporter ATP-binding protein [Peptococcaceae bacterium]
MFRIVNRLIQWTGHYKRRIYRGFVYAFIHSIFTAMPMMLAAQGLSAVLGDYNGVKPLEGRDIWLTLGAMVLAVLGRYLFAYLRAITQESVGYEATAEERLRLGDMLKRVSLGFFSKNNLGELSAAATTDLSFMEMYAMNMVNTVVNGYITVVVLMLFLTFYSPLAGGVALVGVLLSALFLHLLEARSRKNAPIHQKAQDDMVESTIEYLRGMQVVKAFKQEGVSIAGIRKAYRDSKRINIKIEVEYMPFNCLHLFSLKAASMAIVAVAAMLTHHGSMNLPTMLMLDMFSFMIFGSVETMNNAAHVLEVIDATLDKLARIEGAEMIDKDGQNLSLVRTDIAFRDVTFSYDDVPVLQHLSFSLPAGSTTAIVGPSGSGKTTICNLIARFYDVDSGAVTVGGEDVRHLTCDSLLSHISMVFQKVYLFHDTVENNLRFGNPSATQEEIIDAAQKARCHDFIMALPDGYQTLIGEGGSTLSGGEKQRISIARAILKNADIVILDEATASIDPENEHLIQQAISALTTGKTVIVIAHRLATIEHADQILVIDKGQLVQQGTHHALLQQEGLYRRFITIREQAEGWSIA